MTRRVRRRKRKTYFEETMDIVKAILLVVIAVAAVVFVVFFIKDSMKDDDDRKMKASIFSSLFREDEEGETGETMTEEPETGESAEEETEVFSLKDGLTVDQDGNIVFVKNGALVVSSFLEENGKLYYFDEIGMACTDRLNLDAMVLSFGEDGTLKSIRVDTGYQEPYTDYREEYPGLVKDNLLMAYLKEDRGFGRFREIIYKKTVDTMSHILGGSGNPQYTVPGTMQIADGYLYWLPVVSSPDELEALLNGRLFRMKPGAEKRELFAEGVDGYVVFTDPEGHVNLWYEAFGELRKGNPGDFYEDDTPITFTEEMDYMTEYTDGKLYLKTASGYPVTMESEGFHVLGFTYRLKADGEITGTGGQESVKVGDYTYSVRTDEAFGMQRSVIQRTDEAGVQEIISGEFAGSVENIYYNPADRYLYMEYRYPDGTAHIICSSLDGYVDMLTGGDQNASAMRILGFTEGKVYVRETRGDGEVLTEALDVYALTGLALGRTPAPVKPSGQENAELTGPASVSQQSGMGPGVIEIPTTPAVQIGPGVAPGGPGTGMAP